MLKNRRCPLVFRVILFVAALIPEASQAESAESEVAERLSQIQSAEEGHLNRPHSESARRGISSVSPMSEIESHTGANSEHVKAMAPSQSHSASIEVSNAAPRETDSFPRPKFESSNKDKGTLSGHISVLSGNFSNNREQAGNSVSIHPLPTRVFIFNGKLKGLGSDQYAKSPIEALQDPKLATVVTADRDGKYEVKLSPGTYTVLAEINGKLYKNSYDGQGYYTTVEVSSGNESDETIADNSAVNF